MNIMKYSKVLSSSDLVPVTFQRTPSQLFSEAVARRCFLVQVFSCEFCEISKNTFCYRAPLVAASLFSNKFCKMFRSNHSEEHI